MLSTFHQTIHSVVNCTKYGITISLPVYLWNQLPVYHPCSSDIHSNQQSFSVQTALSTVHIDINWWCLLGFKMCFLAYLLLHFTLFHFLHHFSLRYKMTILFQVSKAKPLCIAFILYIPPCNTPTFQSINYLLPRFSHGLLCAISKTVWIKFIQGLR